MKKNHALRMLAHEVSALRQEVYALRAALTENKIGEDEIHLLHRSVDNLIELKEKIGGVK